MILECGQRRLDLATPKIMGIVNVTPDSFSDGGLHLAPPRAVAHALMLAAEGAAIIDFGAESTRPGHVPVPPEEEWARLEKPLAAYAALRDILSLPVLSVDTRNPSTARKAVDAGADIVNSVAPLSGGDDPMARLAAETGAGLVITSSEATPETILADLERQFAAAIAAGCRRSQLVADPGFGFGKTGAGDIAVMRALGAMAERFPVLAGISRKRTLGAITGIADPAKRAGASVAAALAAARAGAGILRVHDVDATCQALKTEEALTWMR